MTAAIVLAINMSIAGIFAIAFAVVAAMNREARGVRWIALGYGMGIVDLALEFLQAGQADPTPVGASIFLVFLLAQSFCTIGVARHYRVVPPWIAMLGIWSLAILLVPVIFSLPYGSWPRSTLYQIPYCAMQLMLAAAVWKSRRRQPLDMLFLILQLVAAAVYLAKPLLGVMIGTAAAPQAYMTTSYAVISQGASVVALIAIALVLLLVIMRDTAAEMIVRSETDILSGLFNRRGFDARVENSLDRAAVADEPAVLVIADLDHFKSINDNFGHAAGDGVIAHFAAMLVKAAPANAIIGRIGGEEFAVLLPEALLSDGRLYAETVRAAFASASLPVLGVDGGFTASFGVAQRTSNDSLFDLSRRADAALYRAKSGGRNCVRVALGELASASAMGAA